MAERIRRSDVESLVITFKNDELFERFSEQLWNDEVSFHRGQPRSVWLSRLDFQKLPEASMRMYQSALQNSLLEGEAAPSDRENRRRHLPTREETKAILRRQSAEAQQRMRAKGIIP